MQISGCERRAAMSVTSDVNTPGMYTPSQSSLATTVLILLL